MASKFYINDRTLFFKWGSNPIKLRNFPNLSQARKAKKICSGHWQQLSHKKSLDQIVDALQSQIDKSFYKGQMRLGL